MSLAPLFESPIAVQIHAFTALALLPLTAVIFALPRGDALHRVLGWSWVIGMTVTAVSSFWIASFAHLWSFSVIHILSAWALISLVLGVRAARRRQIKTHRATMRSLAFFALLIAGAFTLAPGRVMHAVLFGE